MTSAHVTRFSFYREDGLSIACCRWDGVLDGCRGVVQIAHGMGEHIGRYQELAEQLCLRGWTVYGNDHRGHGLTAASPQQRGDFGPGGFNALVADLARLNSLIRNEHPSVALVLLGHSMGSFAAQQFILERSDKIDALALSGSGCLKSLAASLPTSDMDAFGRLLNARITPSRTQFDWLSTDHQAVDAFINDPLCFGALSKRSAESVLLSAHALSDTRSLSGIRPDLPIRLFSGSEDPIGQHLAGVLATAERYRRAGVQSVSLDIEVGARHELIHEIQREAICRRIISWIETR